MLLALILILLTLKISASNFVSRAWRSLLSMLCILFVLLFKASNSSLRECCMLDDVLGVDLEELSQVCCMFNMMNILKKSVFLLFFSSISSQGCRECQTIKSGIQMLNLFWNKCTKPVYCSIICEKENEIRKRLVMRKLCKLTCVWLSVV